MECEHNYESDPGNVLCLIASRERWDGNGSIVIQISDEGLNRKCTDSVPQHHLYIPSLSSKHLTFELTVTTQCFNTGHFVRSFNMCIIYSECKGHDVCYMYWIKSFLMLREKHRTYLFSAWNWRDHREILFFSRHHRARTTVTKGKNNISLFNAHHK